MAESLNSLPENGSNGSNGAPSTSNGAAVPAKPPVSPPAAQRLDRHRIDTGSHRHPLRLRFRRRRPWAPPGDGGYVRRYAHIVGWGYQVPAKVITNHDLEQIVDTTDEWIRSRTGIEERHVAADPKETTASLAVIAARKALEVADVPPNKIDLIICSTTTPEYSFPATACLVQNALGATNAGAFDLSAACSGFVYGLSMARGHILAGDAEYVLVIGAETLSRIVDWTDRDTCVLFGDGAGAVLVAASEVPGGILATELGSDGSGGDALILPGGGSAMPTSLETVSSGQHYIKMDGKAVFRFATRVMANGHTPRARTRRLYTCRRRPGGAAPGQPAHHPEQRAQPAEDSRRKGLRQPAEVRQHQHGQHPDCACARRSKPGDSSQATRLSLSALAPASPGRPAPSTGARRSKSWTPAGGAARAARPPTAPPPPAACGRRPCAGSTMCCRTTRRRRSKSGVKEKE